MNDVDKMLVKQFLLRVRQEGFTIVENPPRSVSGINIDIYRGKTKICNFDDRQLGEENHCSLRVRTDDSTRPEIKEDYHKLFYTFIGLRDLYMLYENAAPLQGYTDSLGYRAITQHNNCVPAVRGGNRLGELEFGTFITGRSSYGSSKSILHNIYFDMDAYPLAKLDFVTRSGLLPKENIITPDSIETAIPAPNAEYIDARILTVKGIFTRQQVDRSTLPKGLYAYDVQYSSDELKPEKLWNSVIGRRFGTVITKRPLPIGEKGYTELKDSTFTLNPEKHPTLRDFQTVNRERGR